MENKKYEAKLKGVPETLLLTLHNRASESKCKNGIIKDTKAEEIYDKIDYDYQRNFGKPEPSHPVRSLIFDKEIRKFIEKNKKSIIINLGEGLETQRYRIQTTGITWYSVDLKEAIDIREQFIQPDTEHKHIACSVLDKKWLNDIPKDLPTIITAQGLLMFFEEKQVKELTNNIAEHFNQATFIFDAIPVWLSKKSMKGLQKTEYYKMPKMPWGIDKDKITKTFTSWNPKIERVEQITFDFSRGLFQKALWKIFTSIPILKNKWGSVVKLEMFKIKNQNNCS